MIYYSTTVTAIGEEVSDLLEGGVLILYADGAPPALAEVSVQHKASGEAAGEGPPVGARVTLGHVDTRVTAVGDTAWNKVRDLGHVVISFNGASRAERPGEICVEACDSAALSHAISTGNRIIIAD